MRALHIDPAILAAECESLRLEVRAFLAEAMVDVPRESRTRSWLNSDRVFSMRMGEKGWIGMTWPLRFGGHERSALERYVVLEETLAAGAPVGAHWTGDRQSGPLLLRYASETLALRMLPLIARGEVTFCIGMSEPDSGSDLSAVRTRAHRTAGGWVINGRKIWSSYAHFAHFMIVLVRTGEGGASRHEGLSQFMVDMSAPGLTVRPILNQLSEGDFNEVVFDDVLVPDDHLIGAEGEGWNQVMAELSLERSGPERYLSATQLLIEMLDAADASDCRQATALGRVVAHYATLRQMSLGVAQMLDRGEPAALAAVLVKDQGSLVEQAMPEVAHELFGGRVAPDSSLAKAMQYMTVATPSFSLRGGTREILRGIIAKGLDLR